MRELRWPQDIRHYFENLESFEYNLKFFINFENLSEYFKNIFFFLQHLPTSSFYDTDNYILFLRILIFFRHCNIHLKHFRIFL